MTLKTAIFASLLTFSLSVSTLAQASEIPRIKGMMIERDDLVALDLSGFTKQGYLIAVKNLETGVVSYTKNNQFYIDVDGYYYDKKSLALRLQGYAPTENSPDKACTLIDLQIGTKMMPPRPTTYVEMRRLNLDAQSSKPVLSFDANNVVGEMYNFGMPVTLINSLSGLYTLSFYFVKSSDNHWLAHVVGNKKELAVGELEFSSSGLLIKSKGLDKIVIAAEKGAAEQTITMDFSNTTQFAMESETNLPKTDGNTAGNYSGYYLDSSGSLFEIYDNGERQLLGKIAFIKTSSNS